MSRITTNYYIYMGRRNERSVWGLWSELERRGDRLLPSIILFGLTAARCASRAAVFAEWSDAEDLERVATRLRPALIEILSLAAVIESTLAVQIIRVDLTALDQPLWKCNSHHGGLSRCNDAKSDGGQRPACLVTCRMVGDQLHGVGSCGPCGEWLQILARDGFSTPSATSSRIMVAAKTGACDSLSQASLCSLIRICRCGAWCLFGGDHLAHGYHGAHIAVASAGVKHHVNMRSGCHVAAMRSSLYA